MLLMLLTRSDKSSGEGKDCRDDDDDDDGLRLIVATLWSGRVRVSSRWSEGKDATWWWRYEWEHDHRQLSSTSHSPRGSIPAVRMVTVVFVCSITLDD